MYATAEKYMLWHASQANQRQLNSSMVLASENSQMSDVAMRLGKYQDREKNEQKDHSQMAGAKKQSLRQQNA